MQILQKSRHTNEDQRVKTLCQNIVMEEVQQQEEVPVLEGPPFLIRAAYEKAVSRGTAHQFVVAAEQQAYQQEQLAASPSNLQESVPEASSSLHGYADLQIDQPAIIPSTVIKKGEGSYPSPFVPLPAQKTIPQSCPLNTEAEKNSMLKAKTDHLSLDIMKPAQMASTQTEEAAYQLTEEENAQSWDSSLDEDCSMKDAGADDVFVSPTQENNGSSFILVVKTTNDIDKYTAAMTIQ